MAPKSTVKPAARQGRRAPPRVLLAVHGGLRREVRSVVTAGRERRLAGVRLRLGQRPQREVVEIHRATTPFGRGDEDLDGTGPSERRSGRPPGKFKMSAPRREPRPIPGEFEPSAIHPPDDLARLVHELQLQVVRRQVTSRRKRQLKIRRQFQWQLTANAPVTGSRNEVDVDSQHRVMTVFMMFADFDRDAFRGNDLPASSIRKIVYDLCSTRSCQANDEQSSTSECRNKPPHGFAQSNGEDVCVPPSSGEPDRRSTIGAVLAFFQASVYWCPSGGPAYSSSRGSN